MIAARVNVMTSLIWGDPEETGEDLERTLNLVQCLLGLSERVAVNLYQLAPLSGTYYAQRHRASRFFSDAVSEFVYPEYLPGLSADGELVELIQNHPEIFPAFYHVESPDFPRKRDDVYRRVAAMQSKLT
jgi:hypothetical protein